MTYAPLNVRIVDYGNHRLSGNDSDVVLRYANSGVLRLPSNASESLPIGFQFAIESGRGTVIVEPDAGVEVAGSVRKSVRRNETGVLVKENANFWLLSLGTGGGGGQAVPLPPELKACFGVSAGAYVGWSAPTDDGGSPVTQYLVEQSENGTDWKGAASTDGQILESIINNLTAGKEYSFRVKAVNENGVSDPSNVLTAIPSNAFNDATGGSVAVITNYNGTGKPWRVHSFASGQSFQVLASVKPFRLFMQGGGAGGGYGGGGGRGDSVDSSFDIPVGSHLVTVGGGVSGGYNEHTNRDAPGNNGNGCAVGSVASVSGGISRGSVYAAGVTTVITGSAVTYGGAGGGCVINQDINTGGFPGGGQGGSVGSAASVSGGGGGGCQWTSGGGAGGAVIIAYEVAPFNDATGGIVTEFENYNGTGQKWRVHTFSGNGTLNVLQSTAPFKVLIVAGGGGGAGIFGNNAQGAGGGAGGAGGVREWESASFTVGDIPVAVGNGGGGGNAGGGNPGTGGDGGASSVGQLSTSGGGGGGIATGGRNGGSGGGGSSAIGNAGGPWGGGAGISGQGTNGTGGSPFNDNSNAPGGSMSYQTNIRGSNETYSPGAAGNGGSGGNWDTVGGGGSLGRAVVAYQIG